MTVSEMWMIAQDGQRRLDTYEMCYYGRNLKLNIGWITWQYLTEKY